VLLKNRIQTYVNEAVGLFQAKAWRTMATLFDNVAPAVADAAAARESEGDKATDEAQGGGDDSPSSSDGDKKSTKPARKTGSKK